MAALPLTQGGHVKHWRETLEGTATAVQTTQDGFFAPLKSGRMHCLCGWPDDSSAVGPMTARWTASWPNSAPMKGWPPIPCPKVCAAAGLAT